MRVPAKKVWWTWKLLMWICKKINKYKIKLIFFLHLQNEELIIAMRAC